jgi:Fe-S cluster assembly iron-binding protein IscA
MILILNTLEVLMLNVTEMAQQQIAEFFKDKKEVKPIRLFLNQSG